MAFPYPGCGVASCDIVQSGVLSMCPVLSVPVALGVGCRSMEGSKVHGHLCLTLCCPLVAWTVWSQIFVVQLVHLGG